MECYFVNLVDCEFMEGKEFILGIFGCFYFVLEVSIGFVMY